MDESINLGHYATTRCLLGYNMHLTVFKSGIQILHHHQQLLPVTSIGSPQLEGRFLFSCTENSESSLLLESSALSRSKAPVHIQENVS